MRTREEMPELSICGTPLRLMTTLRPPRCTMDWSASLSCSRFADGEPVRGLPADQRRLVANGNLQGTCSVINDLLELYARAQKQDRWDYTTASHFFDNCSIRILNCGYENL